MTKLSVNFIGMSKNEYKGAPTSLCTGCGHNSITAQIITVAYELGLKPENIIKIAGIGCSSKSTTYFMSQSHGFHTAHGRMPSVATGATIANRGVRAIGISGDGDTGSIGYGQFRHVLRRNPQLLYLVENNGVYGTTKGQFSATADEGQVLKHYGLNPFPAIDLCLEAIVAQCGFVARSFAGDPKQVRTLLKAALSFKGTAFLDIISPCVIFNNEPDSTKSYAWGKACESPLHRIEYIPVREEISAEVEPGETTAVRMHDGSQVMLHKLSEAYDPTSRAEAMLLLENDRNKRVLTTGLLYYNPNRPTLTEVKNVSDTPLVHLPTDKLRPSRQSLDRIMNRML